MTVTRHARSIAIAAVLGAVVMWSASLSVVRIAVDTVDPGTVTFLRCVVGALVLGAWALVDARRKPQRPRIVDRSAWAWAIGSGATCGAAFLLIAAGMRDVGSGPAGIVLSAIPGLTILLAAPGTNGAGLGTRNLLSLAVGGVGALSLALPAGGGWSAAGLVILAAAALAHAATNVTSGHAVDHLDPIVVAATSMGVAALVALPFASLPTHVPLDAVLAIVALGVLPTGVAYAWYFHGIGVLGTECTAFSNFLVPPVAVVAGVVALGEVPGVLTIVALILSMLALAIGLGGTGPRPQPHETMHA